MVFYQYEPGTIKTVKMRVAADVTKDTAVKLGTNGVIPAGDGDDFLGIAMSSESAGGYVLVAYESRIWKVDLAAAYNPDNGDQVALASSGTVDAGTAGDSSAGVIAEDDPATGGIAKILLTPSQAVSQTI